MIVSLVADENIQRELDAKVRNPFQEVAAHGCNRTANRIELD